MNKILLLALCLAVAPTSAAALPITPVRVSITPVRISSPPVYRAPAIQAPRPVTVYRAPASAPRANVVVQRATAPAVRPMAPRATLRPPVVTQRAQAARPRPTDARAFAQQRRSYAAHGTTWRWTTPTVIPVWWAATMDAPYTVDGYDAFIRRCLDTPRPRRSRACVRALRERGLVG